VILIDTSVWTDHLHRSERLLVEALEHEQVLVHPYVIAELACGSIERRREVLDLLQHLPAAVVASDQEALQLIERRRLMGKGLGYIDVHLLASVLLTDSARLWTRDRRLQSIAVELGISRADR
jgi:predicted nucleic acid-binding protein